ncbi:MAG: signal peptidase I [Gemmatimonadaceae bacterium]
MAVAPKNRPPRADGAKKNVVAAARAGKAPRSGGSAMRRGWEQFKSLAGAIAIFLVIRAFLVEAFRIPSSSMVPTLLVGDWLFVNKLRYGPHVPFTRVTLPGYAEPKRGDVVVFQSPYQADEAEAGRDATPTLVKRLVAVSGDTIQMRGGLLHVNGMPQRQGFGANANFAPGEDHPDEVFAWQNRLAVRGTRFGQPPAVPSHDNWGPLVVPKGHLWMLGDNRYCSKDSRYWGPVPRGNVRGRPLFVYYSYRAGDPSDAQCNPDYSDRPIPFITDIRWGRIGHVIK